MTTTPRLTDREVDAALRFCPQDALWGIRSRDAVLALLASGKTWDEAQDYVERRFASAVKKGTTTIYDWGSMVQIMRRLTPSDDSGKVGA